MSIDHSPFFEDEYESLIDLPGFPYIRIEPMLLMGEVDDIDALWRSQHEELLFALHGKKGDFLVVSNHRLCVYEIPRPMSGATWLGINVLINLPGISTIYGAFDDLKGIGSATAKFTSWVSPTQRKKRKLNEKERMPNPKDIRDVAWDTEDENQVMLISIYRERILLENAFGWKLRTEKYWRNDQESYPRIHFGENGVTLAMCEAGSNETITGSFEALAPCAIPEIAEHVASVNFDLITRYGWTAERREGVILGIAEDPDSETRG